MYPSNATTTNDVLSFHSQKTGVPAPRPQTAPMLGTRR